MHAKRLSESIFDANNYEWNNSEWKYAIWKTKEEEQKKLTNRLKKH